MKYIYYMFMNEELYMNWKSGNIGEWSLDEQELPFFRYSGALPTEYPPYNDRKKCEPDDPWFILGNSGLTLFVHTSGGYQLMSCEHGYARLNHDGGKHSTGWSCWAACVVDGKEFPLIGLEHASVRNAEKHFGCGFASYTYHPESELEIKRTLETIPSASSEHRISAFLCTVTIKNNGTSKRMVRYREGLGARYHLANWNNPPFGRQYARYPVECKIEGKVARAQFNPTADRPLIFAGLDEFAQADKWPAEVHLEITSGSAEVNACVKDDYTGLLELNDTVSLDSGEVHTVQFIIGYSLHDLPWEGSRNQLIVTDYNVRRKMWRTRIPQWHDENRQLATEMQWNTYVLFSMATWEGRYKETYIPQGTLYEYVVGSSSVTRDLMMHALPFCHYAPDFAKSVIRFVCKHTDTFGKILHTDEGCGYTPQDADQKSDSQLWAMQLLTEYLRTTRDFSILHEKVPFLGMMNAANGTVMDRVILWFRYLRDGVHVGRRGLLRILCSDWSDTLYGFFHRIPYFTVFHKGESLFNSCCALLTLKECADQIELAIPVMETGEQKAGELIEAMRKFRAQLFDAVMADRGKRPFVPRAHVGDFTVGENEMFLEPQPFLVGNEDIPLEQRKKLWSEVKKRLFDGEIQGARQRETGGTRASGGVWYALNGPLATFLARVDTEAAEKVLQKMTMANFAEHFPDYWVGMWSGGDSWDSAIGKPFNDTEFRWGGTISTITPQAGRGNPYIYPFPVFCAHAHAWPLFAWLAIRKKQNKSLL